MISFYKISGLFLPVLFSFILFGVRGNAIQAQPVPVPEDPSVSPQVNISGVGVGMIGFDKTADSPGGKGTVNFRDSSLQIGAAQKLFEGGGIGSFEMGWLTTDESVKGNSGPYFLHQAFVDYQGEKFEALIGRSDNPTAHLVDFPTIRGDDLVTLLNPTNPFSNGKNVDEHRYANVASFTLNQDLKYFENIHAQHLINSADPTADAGFNSYGITFQYLAPPGLESFERIPAWALGYERIQVSSATASGINQAILGGTINLNESVTDRVELGLQDIYSWGSAANSFSSITDTFEADSNSIAASIRYLRTPFGRPASQISLTAAYKNYSKISDAISQGLVLTGVRRLGHGFDIVAQYLGQWRSARLAAAQTQGFEFEQRAEIGFAFNFDASFNEHLAPRRTLLNQQHHFISE
jgi:hypothetical protein